VGYPWHGSRYNNLDIGGKGAKQMWVAGRPVGILVLAVLLVLEGLASLAESVELVVMAAGEWPAAMLAAVIGLVLLHKAYSLSQFRYSAWLMTTLSLGLKAATSAMEIVRGYAALGSWLALSLALVIILYLLHPSIRALFKASHRVR